jgi:hypothetical protein
VGTGVPGAPALADPDAGGSLGAAIFGAVGPAMLFDGDGVPRLGTVGGVPRAFALDFPGVGFPVVPPTAGSADAPFFPALGSGAFGDLDGDGLPEYIAATGGVRKLLDVGAPAEQAFGEHQVSAWDPRTGALLPAFPRAMDDMQFLSSPALADVDGDGVAEIVQGSGAYLLRAFRADGSTPAGFPKFTHGWIIASPTAGDVDGDGLVEVIAATREGRLFVWDTPAPATEAALPWPGSGRDRRNTQNLASGVSPLAAPVTPDAALVWALEALRLDVERLREGEGAAARALRGGSAAERLAQAAALVEEGYTSRIAGRLLAILGGLRGGPDAEAGLAPLRERLGEAVRRAAETAEAAVSCAEGERACLRRLGRARRWLGRADAHGEVAHPGAVALRARAFALLDPRAPGEEG